MKTSFSLVKNVLLRILLVTVTMMVMLTASVYYNVFQGQKEAQLAQRQYLVANRVIVDSNLIKLADYNIENIIEAFNTPSASESAARYNGFQVHYFFAGHAAHSDNPTRQYAYETIIRQLYHADAAVQVINDKQKNNYLIVGRLDGVEGLVVNILPAHEVHKAAFSFAKGLFSQSTFILLATLLVTYGVLRYQVQNPLEKIRLAVEAIARGDYRQVTQGVIELPKVMDNEMDLLANAVLETAINVEETHTDLEKKLQERTQALKNANKALYATYSEPTKP